VFDLDPKSVASGEVLALAREVMESMA